MNDGEKLDNTPNFGKNKATQREAKLDMLKFSSHKRIVFVMLLHLEIHKLIVIER